MIIYKQIKIYQVFGREISMSSPASALGPSLAGAFT